MKTRIYSETDNFIAGMTLKDPEEPESGNMALHACKNTEDIIENRRKLADFLHCDLNDFVCAGQTHSANFHKVTRSDKGRGSDTMATAIPDTDALYTYEPNLLLCCFTADCVPVLFHNEKTGLMGIIHSGWQGTVKGIVPRVLTHLREVENCNLSDLNVWIGSALSQNRFEVDEDVYNKYRELGEVAEGMFQNEKTGKYHIDNQLTVKRQCEAQGVRPERIQIDRTCTFDDPEGFSYRRDRECGRHLAFIMKREAK